MLYVVGLLGIVGLFFGLIVLASVLRGWALYMLWGWFLVPLGVPAIGIVWAMGIALIASLLVPPAPLSAAAKNNAEAASHVFFGPLFAIIIGFIIKMFM